MSSPPRLNKNRAVLLSIVALGAHPVVTAGAYSQTAVPAGQESSTGAARKTGRFRFGVELNSVYQTNPRLTLTKDVSGRVDGISVFGSSRLRVERTLIEFSAYTNGAYSAPLPEFTRVEYGGNAQVTRPLGPRVSLVANASFRSALALALLSGSDGTSGNLPATGSSNPGTGSGPTSGAGSTPGTPTPGNPNPNGPLPSPTSIVVLGGGSLSATAHLTAHTTMNASGEYGRSAYLNSEVPGGRSWTGQTNLQRRFSPRLSLGTRLEVSFATSEDAQHQSSAAQTLTFEGAVQAARFDIRLNGGVARLTASDAKASHTLAGGATVQRGFRAGYFSLFASRRALPSFGLDNIFYSTNAGVGAGRLLTKATLVSGSVQTGRSTAARGDSSRFASNSADASIRQVISRSGIAATASGFISDRKDAVKLRNSGFAVRLAIPIR